MFSHDVMAAIFVSQNNETAAMFVSQTSPVGVEFFRELASLMLVTVSTNLIKVTAYHCRRTYCSPKLFFTQAEIRAVESQSDLTILL